MSPTIRWNYYAVRRGTQPDSRGVYDTWEEATVHCTGEKGKKKVPIMYKGFTRRVDADAYVDFENDTDADAYTLWAEYEMEFQRNRIIDHANNVTSARDRNDAYGTIAAYKQVAEGQQNLILLELIRNLDVDNGDVDHSIVYERAQLQLRQSLRPTFDQIFQIYRELLHNKQEAHDKKHPSLLQELQSRSHLRVADNGSCQQCGEFSFLPDTLEPRLCIHCAATGQRRPASLVEEHSSSISTPEEDTPRHQTVPFDWAEANDEQLARRAFSPFIPETDNFETLEQAEKRREDYNRCFKRFEMRRAAAKAEQQEASIDLTDDGNSDTEKEALRKTKRKIRKN